MSQDNRKRLMLRVVIKIMVGFAMLIFAISLLSSLSGPASNLNATPTMLVELTDIETGQAEYTLWENRPILIYKRQQADINALSAASQKLADPQSKRSQQPAAVDVATRSLTPEWFVAFSSGTDLNCPIELLAAGGEFQGAAWMGGFVDTCRGSRYDYAGRVFANQQATRNLAIPPYAFKADGSLLLGANQ